MPLPRFENLDVAEKDRLIAAATAEFARHGYADASLNQILKDAGFSKGTLYYYFADRDDLYAFVVMQAGLALRAGIDFECFAPKTKEEFEPALRRLARLAVEVMQKEPEKAQALRSFQRDLRRNPKPAFAPVIELTRATFRQIVRHGRRLGVVRSDLPEDLLVELLESADEVLDRSLYEDWQLPSALALEQHLTRVMDTFRRLLEPRGATSAGSRSTRARRASP